MKLFDKFLYGCIFIVLKLILSFCLACCPLKILARSENAISDSKMAPIDNIDFCSNWCIGSKVVEIQSG